MKKEHAPLPPASSSEPAPPVGRPAKAREKESGRNPGGGYSPGGLNSIRAGGTGGNAAVAKSAPSPDDKAAAANDQPAAAASASPAAPAVSRFAQMFERAAPVPAVTILGGTKSKAKGKKPAVSENGREGGPWATRILCLAWLSAIGLILICVGHIVPLGSLLSWQKPAPTSINARQLILDYEVGGGEDYYNRFLIMPTWPGELSGVTIGVGYDLGYVTPAQFEEDWGKRLPAPIFERLRPALGISGEAARLLVPALADIRIPWEDARRVFLTRTLPRYEALARSTFPNMANLPDDTQGVLISLVFNRGSSLIGERRTEMAAIAQAIAACRPETRSIALRQIARNIRDMKRLWPTNLGLQRRRDAEAGLVDRCLAALPPAERLLAEAALPPDPAPLMLDPASRSKAETLPATDPTRKVVTLASPFPSSPSTNSPALTIGPVSTTPTPAAPTPLAATKSTAPQLVSPVAPDSWFQFVTAPATNAAPSPSAAPAANRDRTSATSARKRPAPTTGSGNASQ